MRIWVRLRAASMLLQYPRSSGRPPASWRWPTGGMGAVRGAVVAVLLVAGAVLLCVTAATAQESVLRVGSVITISPGERIAGDLVALGGAIDVLGTVDGRVVAVGGTITVDGTVNGDVVGVGGNIRLGPGARVSGDVLAVRGTVWSEPGAVVLGRVATVGLAGAFGLDTNWRRWSAWHWLDYPWTLVYVAGLFGLAVLVAAVVPDHVQAVARHMETDPVRSIAVGMLALLLLVPLTVVLVLTIIGPPLLWLGFLAAKMLGYVALVTLVGRRAGDRLAAGASPVVQLALGVVLVALVRYLPVVGALFSVVVTAWSLGAVLDTKFGTNRPWRPPRHVAPDQGAGTGP